MKIGRIECFAGISGDMLLGALIDAGVPPELLQKAAAALKIGAELRIHSVDRGGIRATKVDVLEHGVPAEECARTHEHHHDAGHSEHEHHHRRSTRMPTSTETYARPELAADSRADFRRGIAGGREKDRAASL